MSVVSKAWVCGVLGLVWAGAACNLDFDAQQYGYLGPDQDAGNNVSGGNNDAENNQNNNPDEARCDDNDGDGFGVGSKCQKDQIDCDDGRSFVFPGAPEVCDNLDNDCDDRVDEDPQNNPLTKECYTGRPVELTREGVACTRGRVACVAGQYPEPVTAELCVGQVLPTLGEAEGETRCDGVDNDCDGTIDPLCACPQEGLVEPCYSAGPPNKRGKGICAEGTRRCFREGANLVWGECEGDVAPGVEACDNPGADDDCDEVPDNVAAVGQACETDEPGRCRPGVWACEGEAQVCVRNLNPTDEVCNNLDEDCDGAPDDGVTNGCGTCEALPGEPGDACGACGDGVYACDERASLVCVDARPLNTCGGCGTLPREPGEGCGTCGQIVCSGANAVRCEEGMFNACGGCGPVVGGELLNSECGICGRYVCDGPNAVECREGQENACGGCAQLAGSPGDECGVCGDGLYACNGINALRCTGASSLNACGGCANLTNRAPNTACGQCGTWRCNPNSQEGEVFCDDPGFNACGGCGLLNRPPGEECGVCGQYVCNAPRTATTCQDFGANACGGCQSLPDDPGNACGECGVYACNGPDALRCEDAGYNTCGGCGELSGEPGEACGACGTWQCTLDRTRVTCQDPGANACGGCGPIAGGTFGATCGTCGRYECADGNTVACDDPGKNACLVCGELATQPGDACDGCGTVLCNGTTGQTYCDRRHCPPTPSAVRVLHGMENGPELDARVDSTIPLTGFGYTDTSTYVRVMPGTHTIDMYRAGTGFSEFLYRYEVTVQPSELVTLVVGGEADGQYDASDIYRFSDSRETAPGLFRSRYTHMLADVPGPVMGEPGPVDIEFYYDGTAELALRVEDIEFGQSSDFIDLPAGAYNLLVYPDGGTLPIGVFNGLPAFAGGDVWSFVHVGTWAQGLGDQRVFYLATLGYTLFP